ncbi:MAG: ATP-grasp domain-containing protein, partial [Deltaproteobacteria bacterium]
MFRKILVANRGEIAVRIMRTCREMGIGTVAIFSEADRGALHVRYADEAYCVGPPPSSESYLRIETILDVAKRAGAEAIHPGYGFLSENARFAQRCHEAGIVFIGPSPESIRQMGDKITARQTVMPAGVPVVPGTEDALPDEETFRREAERIGFPIMLKAKAGGGGKGMRLVRSAEEISSAWRAARSEAKSSFGDDSVYIEKYILSPRHVEIQVLADTHGNTVHLFERECSVQRRHQKVIEETPSRAID